MKILIKQKLSEDLALRDSANRFFDYIEKLSNDSLTISFAGIKSISRSFAHQYVIRKQQSVKEIMDVNVPESVARMFDVVSHPSEKFKLPGKLTLHKLSEFDAVLQ